MRETVTIRPMRSAEYPAYCEYFIDDYGREIAQNFGHSIVVATKLAKQELQRCFPNGLASKEHTLLCIDAEIGGEASLVGYLWHSINSSDSSTFIYDFYVSDEHRSKGYGKQAIAVLEGQLQAMAIKQIKLRVAFQNQRALKLYQEVGFEITGYNMSKQL